MKRYLKVTDGVVFATDDLTKEDLSRARAGSYCAIVDTKYGTVYNHQENRWDAIKIT